MKVLCLHGKGTSGAIFKSQTSTFRNRLSDLNIEYDFLDGQHTTDPAPGVDLFYPPPYFTYWEEDTNESVHAAITWLKNIIATRGPYDAVMTFSQGAALAACALLQHQSQEPNTPPPFKAAIFICGGAPLPFMQTVGYEITPEMSARDSLSRKTLAAQADASSILSRGSDRWSGSSISGSLSEEEIRGEMNGGVRIRIPTVHVYGIKDPRYVAGVQLSETCDASKRRVYDHGGGHEIPRFEAVATRMADLVRWALKEGER